MSDTSKSVLQDPFVVHESLNTLAVTIRSWYPSWRDARASLDAALNHLHELHPYDEPFAEPTERVAAWRAVGATLISAGLVDYPADVLANRGTHPVSRLSQQELAIYGVWKILTVATGKLAGDLDIEVRRVYPLVVEDSELYATELAAACNALRCQWVLQHVPAVIERIDAEVRRLNLSKTQVMGMACEGRSQGETLAIRCWLSSWERQTPCVPADLEQFLHLTVDTRPPATVLERRRADYERGQRGCAFGAERLRLLSERLATPVRPVRDHWFAAWRTVAEAVAANDLESVLVALVAVQETWAELDRIGRDWLAAACEWRVRASAFHDGFDSLIGIDEVGSYTTWKSPDKADLPAWVADKHEFFSWALAIRELEGLTALPVLMRRPHIRSYRPVIDNCLDLCDLLAGRRPVDELREFFRLAHGFSWLAGMTAPIAIAVVPPAIWEFRDTELPTDDEQRDNAGYWVGLADMAMNGNGDLRRFRERYLAIPVTAPAGANSVAADHAPPTTVPIPVTSGPPPLSWLWDNCPLAPNSWGNILGFDDGTSDGYVTEMRLWLPPNAGAMTNRPPMYRPAGTPLPPFYADGGTRRCRVPTPRDLDIIRRYFPDLADPSNPDWGAVAALLLTAGHRRADLEGHSPPELLALLDAAGIPKVEVETPSGKDESDGPFGIDGFRFAGVEVRFGRAAKQLTLVLALWDCKKHRPTRPRPIQDVMNAVYGEGNETEDSAFRQLCSDSRRKFQAANCPLDVRVMNGQVELARCELS